MRSFGTCFTQNKIHMKKTMLFAGLLALLATSCKKEEGIDPQPEPTPTEACEVVGRWRGPYAVLYQFTDAGELFFIYPQPDGTFGENPEGEAKNYEFTGDSIYIYHSSTSVQRLKLEFDCDCRVMNWTDTSNPFQTVISTYYTEDLDWATCE
jgi:hypothetical protein